MVVMTPSFSASPRAGVHHGDVLGTCEWTGPWASAGDGVAARPQLLWFCGAGGTDTALHSPVWPTRNPRSMHQRDAAEPLATGALRSRQFPLVRPGTRGPPPPSAGTGPDARACVWEQALHRPARGFRREALA